MILFQFVLGFLIYATYAYVSYTPAMKTSNWYFPAGLTLALFANAVWLWIAKSEFNPSQLLIKGLFWDVIVTVVTIGAPLLMFGAKLTTLQLTGLGLLIVGLILVKV